MSNSLQPHGLEPARLLCPWNSPGKNTEVGSCSLLQGIFPTQESNLGFLHCRRIPYCLSHQVGASRLYLPSIPVLRPPLPGRFHPSSEFFEGTVSSFPLSLGQACFSRISSFHVGITIRVLKRVWIKHGPGFRLLSELQKGSSICSSSIPSHLSREGGSHLYRAFDAV